MFLNRSFVCSEISSLCESHDSGFYKQKGKRFSLMIINGIWVWGILWRGFKKRTIYCWKELVLGRNWWKKKSNFGFRHNLATICRHCHDHDSGHLRNAIHSLSRLMDLLKVMFLKLSNLCDSNQILHIWPLFVCKEKRNKSVHEKRIKIARKKLTLKVFIKQWFGGGDLGYIFLAVTNERIRQRAEVWVRKYLYLK